MFESQSSAKATKPKDTFAKLARDYDKFAARDWFHDTREDVLRRRESARDLSRRAKSLAQNTQDEDDQLELHHIAESLADEELEMTYIIDESDEELANLNRAEEILGGRTAGVEPVFAEDPMVISKDWRKYVDGEAPQFVRDNFVPRTFPDVVLELAFDYAYNETTGVQDGLERGSIIYEFVSAVDKAIGDVEQEAEEIEALVESGGIILDRDEPQLFD